jgi:dolichol-phosphate mannosyltransferase
MLYILLPAYNEEKNISKIFIKIAKIKKKISPFKVVLVDDCSKDNTQKLMKKNYGFKLIHIKHKQNKGLSITLETGFNFIKKKIEKNDVIITLDCDDTHPVEIIPKMMREINSGYQLVIASRFVVGSKINGLSNFRKIMSIGAKFLFKTFYPYKNLGDYTCNYRCYSSLLIKEVLKKKKFFKNEDFNIAAKILIFLIKKKNNLKLKEIPFTLNYQRKVGQSKMNIIKTIFLTLRLIFFKNNS